MSQENIKRMVGIVEQAEQDSIDPAEYVRRTIQKAINNGNPLVNAHDQFVIVGIDGMDRSLFPCGSFPDIEKARALVQQKNEEEPDYSSGNDVMTTFHVL